MKKVFLSLAMIAALTVVSCKSNSEKAADATAVDSTAVAPEVAPEAPMATDSMATPAKDSMATPATPAPAAAPAK